MFMNCFIPVSYAPWHPRYTFHCRDSLGEKYVQTILFFLKPSNQAVKMRHCIFQPLFHTVLLLCTVKNICFSPFVLQNPQEGSKEYRKGNTVYSSTPVESSTCTIRQCHSNVFRFRIGHFLRSIFYSAEAILPRLNCSQVDSGVHS